MWLSIESDKPSPEHRPVEDNEEMNIDLTSVSSAPLKTVRLLTSPPYYTPSQKTVSRRPEYPRNSAAWRTPQISNSPAFNTDSWTTARQSPRFKPTSPSYNSNVFGSQTISPPCFGEPVSPICRPRSPDFPGSPNFTPTSPSYNPNSPGYQTMPSPIYAPYSPNYDWPGWASPNLRPTSPSFQQSASLYSDEPKTPEGNRTLPCHTSQSPMYRISSPAPIVRKPSQTMFAEEAPWVHHTEVVKAIQDFELHMYQTYGVDREGLARAGASWLPLPRPQLLEESHNVSPADGENRTQLPNTSELNSHAVVAQSAWLPSQILHGADFQHTSAAG